jgi:transposase
MRRGRIDIGGCRERSLCGACTAGLRRDVAFAPACGSRSMTMLPRAVAIFAATEPVDMRRSFDRLAAAKETLGQDPRSGAPFLFVNRSADRLKALWWDRTGYCILYKRLERGTFRMPSALRAREARRTREEALRCAVYRQGARPHRTWLHQEALRARRCGGQTASQPPHRGAPAPRHARARSLQNKGRRRIAGRVAKAPITEALGFVSGESRCAGTRQRWKSRHKGTKTGWNSHS